MSMQLVSAKMWYAESRTSSAILELTLEKVTFLNKQKFLKFMHIRKIPRIWFKDQISESSRFVMEKCFSFEQRKHIWPWNEMISYLYEILIFSIKFVCNVFQLVVLVANTKSIIEISLVKIVNSKKYVNRQNFGYWIPSKSFASLI